MKNHLPREPGPKETPEQYGKKLLKHLDELPQPEFVHDPSKMCSFKRDCTRLVEAALSHTAAACLVICRILQEN